MNLIDTHCHLYLPEFDNDRSETVRRAIEAGVSQMYLPNVDSGTIVSMHELEQQFPQNCFAMMGLHPCSVAEETYLQELKIVESWLSERKYIAIGEIGLDLYWDKSTFEIQRKALHHQCQLALDYNLPIVIHSRESTRECIDVIRPFTKGSNSIKGVFHCFSGTAMEAEEIEEMGFLLGIGGVLTYKKSNLAESIKDVSNNSLVLETDAPYLSPVPFRGKRNESSYISYILDFLAQARMIDKEELARITTKNALDLFQKG